MDVEIYLFSIKSQILTEYHKVKLSREEWIEKKWSHRTDIIESMKRSEKALLEIRQCFDWMEKVMRADSSRNFDLEKICMELRYENDQLKKTVNDMSNRINL
jgi:glutaredoxin 2